MKETADGGNKGGAASQEDVIDIAFLDAGLLQQPIDVRGDRVQLLHNPALEHGPGSPSWDIVEQAAAPPPGGPEIWIG